MESDESAGRTADEVALHELHEAEKRRLQSEREARYRATHREELKCRARERRARDPERHRKMRQERRARRNQDEIEALCAKQRRWFAENPERVLQYTLRYAYGLDVASYSALLEAQGSACAICRREERRINKRTGKPTRLAVDHCHRTGVVRGLLCSGCNTAIGLLDESASIIQSAMEYLARFEPDSLGP